MSSDVVTCIRDRVSVPTLAWCVESGQGAPGVAGLGSTTAVKRSVEEEQPEGTKRPKEGGASSEDADFCNYVPLQVKVTSKKRT